MTALGAVALGLWGRRRLAAACVLGVIASAQLPVLAIPWALLAALSGERRGVQAASVAGLLVAAGIFFQTVGTCHLGDLQWAPLKHAAKGGWLAPAAGLLVASAVFGGLIGPLLRVRSTATDALQALAATYLLLRVSYLFVRAPGVVWVGGVVAGVVAVIAARRNRPALAHGAIGVLGAAAGAFGPAAVHGPLGALGVVAGGRLGAWSVGGLPGSAVGITLAGIVAAAAGTHPFKAPMWMAWGHDGLAMLALLAALPMAERAIRYRVGGSWLLGLLGLALAPLMVPELLDRELLTVFGEVGARRMTSGWMLRWPWAPFAFVGGVTLITTLSSRSSKRSTFSRAAPSVTSLSSAELRR